VEEWRAAPSRVVARDSVRLSTVDVAQCGASKEAADMSVILINPFEVPPEADDEEFLRGWERAADYMRQQPGFLSSRLHRALAPDARFRFINVAEWASPQDFQTAVTSEEFREIAKGAGPGSPALYEVVRSM
jgi:heme-degrading monooxygenase HmoA